MVLVLLSFCGATDMMLFCGATDVILFCGATGAMVVSHIATDPFPPVMSATAVWTRVICGINRCIPEIEDKP